MYINQTSCINPSSDEWLFYPANFPFYYSCKEHVVDGIPDHFIALASPILAYWSLSMFFHYLDVSGWEWLEKYRIHESEQAMQRNVVSRSHVVGAVIFQQVIQTLLGLVWMSEEKRILNHPERMRDIGALIRPLLTRFLGEWGPVILPRVIHLTYWWFIPAAQFAFAM
jgi:sphinganine C4-monooxygenase